MAVMLWHQTTREMKVFADDETPSPEWVASYPVAPTGHASTMTVAEIEAALDRGGITFSVGWSKAKKLATLRAALLSELEARGQLVDDAASVAGLLAQVEAS